MAALVHFGANLLNSNSPLSKQKPTLSRHQNTITATVGGGPYPGTGIVRLLFWALKIICTNSLAQSRTSKALGERMAERRQKHKVGTYNTSYSSLRALT
jgi:hypothetical protein